MTSKELGELYIEYSKFCPTIKPIDMNDVDIDYILVSNKCPIGENVFYYVNHSDDNKTTLCINLLKLMGS